MTLISDWSLTKLWIHKSYKHHSYGHDVVFMESFPFKIAPPLGKKSAPLSFFH